MGAEANAVGADGRGQRQISTSPRRSVVGGEVAAHGIAEDLVRSRSQHAGGAGINGDERLALRSTLVGNIDVGAYAQRCAGTGQAISGMVQHANVPISTGPIVRADTIILLP